MGASALLKDKCSLSSVDYREVLESAKLDRLRCRGIAFIVSYDGRTGAKLYGRTLPESLGLTHVEIPAGRSTQATLLGRDDSTFESLYLSPEITVDEGHLRYGPKAKDLTSALFPEFV